MALVMTDIQQVALSIQPVSQAGNPAPVDGIPTWDVSNPAVGTLTVAPDGMSAMFVTSGSLGDTQVSVSADADLGAGITTITGTLDISVLASQATTLGINAGTPVAKP